MDKHIGAQYYTIRDFTKTLEDFDLSCKKIADIGYTAVQISGGDLSPKDMREILDKYGLKVVVTHKGFQDFEKDLDAVIEYNRILGSDICGVGVMPKEYTESTSTIMDFINKANKMCETLKKENMYFGYHNHCMEFLKFDGKFMYDYLKEETNPEIFNFITDTYWYQVGGRNPKEELEALGKRAMIVHLKDYGVNPETRTSSVMKEIGEGNLKWDEILETCEKIGVRWAVVEQDYTYGRDPFESLKMSYDYLAKKGYC